MKQNPDNSSAYNNRGAAKLGLNQNKEALEDFNTAIKLKDDYSDAYNNRGKAKMNLGDKTGACEDWHKSYYLGLEDSMQLIIKYCK